MRTRTLFCLAAVSVLVITAAASWAADSATPLPDATGKAVVEYITKTDPYQNWALVPGTTPFRKGMEPHGALQKVYANAIAQKGFADPAAPMPNGSMIIKEIYSPDKKLTGITLMYKKAGFNPDDGDYMWAALGADYSVEKEGKLGGCAGCHSQAKRKDYVILRP